MDPVTTETETSSPSSGATTEATWQEKVKELEGKLEQERFEKKGIYRDLQSEKERRQTYEQMLTRPRTETVPDDDPAAFVDKVNREGKRPIRAVVEETVTPLQKTVMELAKSIEENDALDDIARQESLRQGKMLFRDDIKKGLKGDLIDIAKEHNLLGLDWKSGSRAAYTIWLQRQKEKETAHKTEETERDKTISSTTTESTRSSFPKAPASGKVYTRSEIATLVRSATSQKELDEYKRAFSEGRVK